MKKLKSELRMAFDLLVGLLSIMLGIYIYKYFISTEPFTTELSLDHCILMISMFVIMEVIDIKKDLIKIKEDINNLKNKNGSER